LEGSGAPLGTSWALLGGSWGALGRFFGVQNRAFFKHGSKIGSKRPFGSILEGFGEGLGRFWGGIWEDLGAFRQVMGEFWMHLGTFSPAGADSIIGPPR